MEYIKYRRLSTADIGDRLPAQAAAGPTLEGSARS